MKLNDNNCDNNSNNINASNAATFNMIQRYYQEKKQLRKELFKWNRQITEYCGLESLLEYILPVDQFKLYNKDYQGKFELKSKLIGGFGVLIFERFFFKNIVKS